MLTLQTLPSQAAAVSTTERCVNEQGFSLHAEVRLAINQRHKLEHLCRYITRPAIAHERLAFNQAGQVVLTLKTPYRDGTTQTVMEPLEFMASAPPHSSPVRACILSVSMACSQRTPSLRPQIIPSAPPNATDDASGHAETPQSSAPVRLSWARLLKRVFDIDIEHCPNCGGPLLRSGLG